MLGIFIQHEMIIIPALLHPLLTERIPHSRRGSSHDHGVSVSSTSEKGFHRHSDFKLTGNGQSSASVSPSTARSTKAASQTRRVLVICIAPHTHRRLRALIRRVRTSWGQSWHSARAKLLPARVRHGDAILSDDSAAITILSRSDWVVMGNCAFVLS